MGRGGHHGQAMVPTVVAAWLFSPLRRILVFRCFALRRAFLPFLGSFGPPHYHLLILMALTSLAWIHLKHFSQNLGMNRRNSQ